MSITRNKDKNEKKIFLKHWKKYSKNTFKILETINSKELYQASYTDFFFDNYPLASHFQKLHTMQLGAEYGLFLLKTIKEKQCHVKGYEYNKTAIMSLKRNDVPYREIDLDSLKNDELLYINELKEDLKEPSNIIAIRILEYLDTNALSLLLFNMINFSKAGSTFFLTNAFNDKHDSCFGLLPKNYIASFFSPRTDIQILYHNKTNETWVQNPCALFLVSTQNRETDKISDNQNLYLYRFKKDNDTELLYTTKDKKLHTICINEIADDKAKESICNMILKEDLKSEPCNDDIIYKAILEITSKRGHTIDPKPFCDDIMVFRKR